MRAVATELRAIVDQTVPRLQAWSDEEARCRRSAGKWSRKEILGHLIDSASNNHQRFVRAGLQGELRFPPYAQDGWVAVQHYHDATWGDLVSLWRAYNIHVAHVIATIPPERLAAPCVIGDGETGTLEWLMRDYVRHQKHHLAQIFD